MELHFYFLPCFLQWETNICESECLNVMVQKSLITANPVFVSFTKGVITQLSIFFPKPYDVILKLRHQSFLNRNYC